MKTTLVTLALLTIAHADLHARPTNIVWMVDYVLSAGTNASISVDYETIGKALDVVAKEFTMTPIPPGQPGVIRTYQANPDLMIGLDATSETNRIVVHTTPMMPRIKTTDAHRQFYSRLEAELDKAFRGRVRKEENHQDVERALDHVHKGLKETWKAYLSKKQGKSDLVLEAVVVFIGDYRMEGKKLRDRLMARVTTHATGGKGGMSFLMIQDEGTWVVATD